MADTPSKKYKGVYYRQLKNGDRSYYVILRIEGKQKRISIGKKSEGITEAFCYQQKVKIINAEKFGEGQAEILQRVKKSEPTFTDLVNDYIKYGSAKASSKQIIKYLLNIVPFTDKRRVTEQDISDWLIEYGETVRPGTVNSKINLLRIIFKHAIARKIYRHADPMANIQTLKVDDKRLRWLTRQEVNQLLAAIKNEKLHSDNLYLFTKLALCTGARIGTLVRIHQKDIKGDTVSLYNIKTDRRYIGFLDEETQQLLKGRTGYVLSFKDPSELPGVEEYQWRMLRILNRLFNEGVTYPLDRVVVHSLRHTTASLLIQNGTPLHVVQKVLDHQSIRSTERYAKLHQENIKTEANRLWQ